MAMNQYRRKIAKCRKTLNATLRHTTDECRNCRTPLWGATYATLDVSTNEMNCNLLQFSPLVRKTRPPP